LGVRFAWCLILVGCGASPRPATSASQWDAADAIFHSDPRWLGGDAAYSVDLGGDRTAWFFGDTLVAKTAANVRTESKMVRNTVAIQTGRDPTTATLAFAWKTDATDGTPASFFPESGEAWHWPGHGVRIPSGPLVVFLSVVKSTTSGGMFGFTYDGWKVALVDNPDRPASEWSVRFVNGPKPAFDAVPGAAIVRQDGFVFAFAPQFSGSHDAYLARFDEKALLAGTLTAEWWTGTEWRADGSPKVVIESAGTELSVHFDARISKWVHVTSHGFGASTIAIRTADRIEGPWSAQSDVYTPPESKSAKPFVYAAKAHPELSSGTGDLVVTYATNSFDFGTLFKPEGAALYWPRFVRISFASP
jgi:hypothetical protein